MATGDQGHGGGVNGECHWQVKASTGSHHCINPIRQFEENVFREVLDNKRTDIPFIKLSIGDTTALPVHPAVPQAVQKVLDAGGSTGYGHSRGLVKTREAIAALYSPHTLDPGGLTSDDVVMTNACSGALQMCVDVLTEPGQNILIPSPGFGLYACLAGYRHLKCHFYKLLEERGWEVDLQYLEKQIDSDTAALVINNPSNPCGSSYSRQHLQDILSIAEKYHIPVIADETYAWMSFPGSEFHMLSSVSQNVPILSCSSLSKRFMVPGWRSGWIVIHDRHNAFKEEVTPGLYRLATKVLGPSTLVQAAIPDIFSNVPEEYHRQNVSLFHRNAQTVTRILSAAPGLRPVMPSATMYIMVVIKLECFPEFSSDVEFTRSLIVEQNVFCLPGPGFNTSGCFRIVLGCGEQKIEEACQRITDFAKQHYKQ